MVANLKQTVAATIIIHGPMACGKTHNADKLARKYRVIGVVDGWTPGKPVRQGHLHLTCEHLGEVKGARVIAFEDAMKGIRP